MLFRFLLSFFGILICLESVWAQEIDKVCPETDFNLRINAEFFFKDGSFIFYENNWQLGQNQTYRKINSLPFYQMYHLVGYEIPLGGRWAGGLGIRQNYFNGLRVSAIRGHFNHSSQISKIVFFKELTFEHFWQNPRQRKYNRAGLRLMFGRDFQLKTQNFRPVFGYDLFKNFEADFLGKNRRIQETNLRLGLDYFLRKNLSLGIYYDKRTNYYFADEQYVTDKQTGNLVKIPARKLNIILPIWTVRLHWQWQKNDDIKKRIVF